MATPAQTEANRLNAQRSTGPRTDAGKQRSAANATLTGLFCRRLLLPGEDASELELLRESLESRLAPVGAIECLYVGRLIAATWRLQRAIASEARIFRQWGREVKCPEDLHAHEFVGKESERVQRHIAVLERSIDKALGELKKVQDRRKELGEAEVPDVAAPRVVDDTRSVEATNNAIVENEPNLSDGAVLMAHSGARGDADITAASSAKIEIVKTNPIEAALPREDETLQRSREHDDGQSMADGKEGIGNEK